MSVQIILKTTLGKNYFCINCIHSIGDWVGLAGGLKVVVVPVHSVNVTETSVCVAGDTLYYSV
jgi:hypothetical protein